MNTKLVVLRNGEPLFEYPIELDADVGLAVGATMALSEFHRLNPTISLLDPEISIRFKNSSELHYPAPTIAITSTAQMTRSIYRLEGSCVSLTASSRASHAQPAAGNPEHLGGRLCCSDLRWAPGRLTCSTERAA